MAMSEHTKNAAVTAAPEFNRKVRSKIAAHVVLVSFLAAVIVVFANYGLLLLGRKHDLRRDLTVAGRHALDGSTKDLARGIEDDVRIYLVTGIDQSIREASRANLTANTPDGGIMKEIYLPLLDRMAGDIGALASELSQINPRIRYAHVRLADNPELANEWRKKLDLGPEQLLNHLVVQNVTKDVKKTFSVYRIFDLDLGGPDPTVGHRRPTIRGDFIEVCLRFGLKRVLDVAKRRGIMSIGHGEETVSTARQFLEGEEISFSDLDLDGNHEGIPEDTDVLVVASPSRPFQDRGRRVLREYLEGGGRVLLLQGRRNREPFKDLLETCGLELARIQVGHPTWNVASQGPYTLRGLGFLESGIDETKSPHIITASVLAERLPVQLGFSRAYREFADYDRNLVSRRRLLGSGENGELMPLIFDGKDWRQAPEQGVKRGNLGLGYAIEMRRGQETPGRLVLIASDDWLKSANLIGDFSLANSDLFTNAAYWLTDKEKLITGTPRRFRGRFVQLEEEDHTTLLTFTVLILPCFILLIGLTVFFVRRRS